MTHNPGNSECPLNDPETFVNPAVQGLACTCSPKPHVTLGLPWDLHIEHCGDGDTSFQFQNRHGDVLFEFRDSEYDIPALARRVALHIFATINGDQALSATIDGDAAGKDRR